MKSIPVESMTPPLPLEALPVMESFYTLQGEGFHSGTAAYFIRLAGCDVGCVWCDVKESWDAEIYPSLTPERMATQAAQVPASICVVTGGEPLMYDLTALTDVLHQEGKLTHVETSGAYPLTGKWDWITFSPKKFKEPQASVCAHANELKVVVYHPSDVEWAMHWGDKVSDRCHCYVQPEWSKRERIMPLLVEFVKDNPRWKISLQSHKYLQIP